MDLEVVNHNIFFSNDKAIKNSSLLEHAEFDKKVGIVEYSDKYGDTLTKF